MTLKLKLRNLVKKLLSGNADIIVIMRKIENEELGKIINDEYLIYFCKNFVSDTDFIPKGKARSFCAQEFLDRMDKEEKEILEFYKDNIKKFAHKFMNFLDMKTY